jgi:hypothetical protein
VPPILVTALPHLTRDYEALYDELEPFCGGGGGRRSTSTIDMFDGCAGASIASGWSSARDRRHTRADARAHVRGREIRPSHRTAATPPSPCSGIRSSA